MKIITDLGNHPCFNKDVKHSHGRVHLPVAPRCNIKCNYCNRLFDCPNEGRPGVTSRVMRPKESLANLAEAMASCRISVAGIAGPGDPLANPDQTFTTFGLVKRKYPHLLRCLSTNGLSALNYIREIIHYASHVTLTVNAVDAEIGSKIYKWIKLGDHVHTGADAASIMLERQLESIRQLKHAGVIVKVNTVVIPGINDTHTEEIAMVMKQLSVDMYNAMPLYPVKGTPLGDIPEPSAADIAILRKRASAHLPQMHHCSRCRADAVGLIGADTGSTEINWRQFG